MLKFLVVSNFFLIQSEYLLKDHLWGQINSKRWFL